MPLKPLVSIGLPTYNRVTGLRRAVDSVLVQDYPNLELVISDNASTDKTQDFCEGLCHGNPRIRYFRQAVNNGATANFQAVLNQARGEFFMWLADDDWLAPDYISRCVDVLLKAPDYAIACGLAKHCKDDGTVLYDGERINLPQASGKERVLEYFRQVRRDGTFYAVMRREQLSREPLRNVLASDWLIISSIVFTGKVKMLDDTYLYRTDGGASATLESVVRSLGMPLFFASNGNAFYLRIAISVFNQILVVSPAFRSLGIVERLSLAYAASREVQKRFINVPRLSRLNRLRNKVMMRQKRIIKGGNER